MYKLITALCLMLCPFFLSAKKQAPHVAAWEQFARKLNTKMCQQYGLYCDGQGGSFRDNIEAVYLTYDCCVSKPPTVDEARLIAMEAHATVFTTLVQDPSMQPYLNPNPFSLDQVRVQVSFSYKDGQPVKGESEIFTVLCSRDKVKYYNYNKTCDPYLVEKIDEAFKLATADEAPFQVCLEKPQRSFFTSNQDKAGQKSAIGNLDMIEKLRED